jgi:hypothetical protein
VALAPAPVLHADRRLAGHVDHLEHLHAALDGLVNPRRGRALPEVGDDRRRQRVVFSCRGSRAEGRPAQSERESERERERQTETETDRDRERDRE